MPGLITRQIWAIDTAGEADPLGESDSILIDGLIDLMD